jgi:L-malate glycosyltransferase
VRILVYPHDLEIGGSQLNAVEIAAAVRDLGHDVVVFGRPGALNGRIDELGLEFVPSPELGRRPSPAVVHALARLARERRIDVLHGYEWPPALEATLAARGRRDVRSVATVMSMAVAPFIPRTVPLLVGTEQIAAVERRAGRERVGVLEPPVALADNGPGLAPGVDDFAARWGLDKTRHTIVSVTRLAHQLKLEGLLAAMDAVAQVSTVDPARLVIVGDGPARDIVAAKAAEVNARAPGTVVLTGELLDPRPAYALADVSLGMGGSALRTLAFAKPLVVQGEGGYWRLLTPESLPEFLWAGWYGVADDPAAGAGTLRDILAGLLADVRRRDELGAFGRSVVEDRFSLTRAAATQVGFYEKALASRPGFTTLGDLRAGYGFVDYKLRRLLPKLVGRRATDDFNARPVARQERDRTAGQ